MKKIIGIFICIIFLFSSLPTTTSTSPEKIDNELLSEIKDSNNNLPPNRYIFSLYIGTIILNGIFYEDGFWWYNVTPINLRAPAIIYVNEQFYFLNEIITDNPAYVNKDILNHGFVSNNFMFIWGGTAF